MKGTLSIWDKEYNLIWSGSPDEAIYWTLDQTDEATEATYRTGSGVVYVR